MISLCQCAQLIGKRPIALVKRIEPVGPAQDSFGVAELRDHDTYETLFERADRAQYRAKKDGRNRTASMAA